MQLAEAKARFIADWGRFGTNWGINRTMAQIHALLLVSPDPLSAEAVMEELAISRSNFTPVNSAASARPVVARDRPAGSQSTS